jgi:hypothetical protein
MEPLPPVQFENHLTIPEQLPKRKKAAADSVGQASGAPESSDEGEQVRAQVVLALGAYSWGEFSFFFCNLSFGIVFLYLPPGVCLVCCKAGQICEKSKEEISEKRGGGKGMHPTTHPSAVNRLEPSGGVRAVCACGVRVCVRCAYGVRVV